MKMLTIEQAWKVIAETYAIPRDERNKYQSLLTHEGICCALWILSGEMNQQRFMSSDQFYDMREEAFDLQYLQSGCYIISISKPKNDFIRADFCYLMAYSNGGV